MQIFILAVPSHAQLKCEAVFLGQRKVKLSFEERLLSVGAKSVVDLQHYADLQRRLIQNFIIDTPLLFMHPKINSVIRAKADVLPFEGKFDTSIVGFENRLLWMVDISASILSEISKNDGKEWKWQNVSLILKNNDSDAILAFKVIQKYFRFKSKDQVLDFVELLTLLESSHEEIKLSSRLLHSFFDENRELFSQLNLKLKEFNENKNIYSDRKEKRIDFAAATAWYSGLGLGIGHAFTAGGGWYSLFLGLGASSTTAIGLFSTGLDAPIKSFKSRVAYYKLNKNLPLTRERLSYKLRTIKDKDHANYKYSDIAFEKAFESWKKHILESSTAESDLSSLSDRFQLLRILHSQSLLMELPNGEYYKNILNESNDILSSQRKISLLYEIQRKRLQIHLIIEEIKKLKRDVYFYSEKSSGAEKSVLDQILFESPELSLSLQNKLHELVELKKSIEQGEAAFKDFLFKKSSGLYSPQLVDNQLIDKMKNFKSLSRSQVQEYSDLQRRLIQYLIVESETFFYLFPISGDYFYGKPEYLSLSNQYDFSISGLENRLSRIVKSQGGSLHDKSGEAIDPGDRGYFSRFAEINKINSLISAQEILKLISELKNDPEKIKLAARLIYDFYAGHFEILHSMTSRYESYIQRDTDFKAKYKERLHKNFREIFLGTVGGVTGASSSLLFLSGVDPLFLITTPVVSTISYAVAYENHMMPFAPIRQYHAYTAKREYKKQYKDFKNFSDSLLKEIPADKSGYQPSDYAFEMAFADWQSQRYQTFSDQLSIPGLAQRLDRVGLVIRQASLWEMPNGEYFSQVLISGNKHLFTVEREESLKIGTERKLVQIDIIKNEIESLKKDLMFLEPQIANKVLTDQSQGGSILILDSIKNTLPVLENQIHQYELYLYQFQEVSRLGEEKLRELLNILKQSSKQNE